MKLRLVLTICFISFLGVAGQAADKKRVAVMNFEFGTVQQWWSGNWDIGKGISDLIVNELVTAETYRVIERNRLDEILAEQDLGESGRANPASAAKVGKVLGVNAMIVGTVRLARTWEFERCDEMKLRLVLTTQFGSRDEL